MLTFLGCWLLASFIGGIVFCWLLKTKRIGFEVIKERAPTIDDWLERRI